MSATQGCILTARLENVYVCTCIIIILPCIYGIQLNSQLQKLTEVTVP